MINHKRKNLAYFVKVQKFLGAFHLYIPTLFALVCLLLSGCEVLQKTAKHELSDGFYNKKSSTENSAVYVDLLEDNIRIHPVKKINNEQVIDTLQKVEIYRSEIKTKQIPNFALIQKSFDVDFLTIPLKFRFSQNDVLPQLNANLNGAVYFGYRTDAYKINYQQNPLKSALREINHFGYSIGLFTGFGNTYMSATNTNNILQQEYDGIVWSKGIAGIVAINNFTIGLTFGFDNLIDKNKNIWIYENKPWIGFGFGLNLN